MATYIFKTFILRNNENKMVVKVDEKKKNDLGLTHFLFWFHFQYQAIKALLKSKSYAEVVKRVIRIFFIVI